MKEYYLRQKEKIQSLNIKKKNIKHFVDKLNSRTFVT